MYILFLLYALFKILSALKMETICEQEEEDEILSEKNDEELLQTILNSNRQLAG